tara:strand:+ start:481 stop:1095 length:615 start_codon:yes stop_codon:yes gene_type:complete
MVILSAIDLTKKVRNEINKLAGEAHRSMKMATENNGYVGYLTVDDHVVACCFCYEDTYMKDKNPSCATWARKNECKKNAEYMLVNCPSSCERISKGKLKQIRAKHKTMSMFGTFVKRNYRGKGLCKRLTREFVRKFGDDYVLYLTLKKNNEANKRCKQLNDFFVLTEAGTNDPNYDASKTFAMIRIPTSKKSKSRKRRRKTKRK